MQSHQYFTLAFFVQMCFSLVHFGFIIFGQKDIGKKIAHKMLMKLTPGVYFVVENVKFICFTSCQIIFVYQNSKFQYYIAHYQR